MPLKCRLDSLNLSILCEYHRVKRWALEGATLAECLGRGGGCTHTHTRAITFFCHLLVKSSSENRCGMKGSTTLLLASVDADVLQVMFY